MNDATTKAPATMTPAEKRAARQADRAFAAAVKHIRAAYALIGDGVQAQQAAGLRVSQHHLETVVGALGRAERVAADM